MAGVELCPTALRLNKEATIGVDMAAEFAAVVALNSVPRRAASARLQKRCNKSVQYRTKKSRANCLIKKLLLNHLYL
jgi:hypothetical protein